MKLKSFLLLLASSATLYASSIEVEDAYVRATPPNLPNSAAFMEIKNETNENISLVSASSKVSKVVELHNHGMKDGVMKMYQVPKIEIKANSKKVLKPGGLHVMFIGLKNKPLKPGQKVSFSLKFSNGETVNVIAPVKKVMRGMMKHKGMEHGMGGHGHHGMKHHH